MKKPGHLASVALILLLSALFSPAPAETIILGRIDSYPVRFDYLRDEGGSLTMKEIRDSRLDWQSSRDNFGFTTDIIWARFTVMIPEDIRTQWYLEMGYPLMDVMDVHLPQPDGTYAQKRYGDLIPFGKRDIMHHAFLVKLLSEPGSYTYYCRFQTNGAMSIPMKILSDRQVISSINYEKTIFGLFYGALLIILLYNLLLAVSMRDLSYLFYSIFIVSLVLVSLSLNGYGFQYIWPNTLWLNDQVPFFLFSAIVCFAVFALYFIGFRALRPVFQKVFIGYIGVVALCAIASPFTPYHIGITVGAGAYLPGIVLTVALSVDEIIKKNRNVIFFGIAFTTLLAGVIVSVLYYFGLIQAGLTLWGFQIGTVISIALFSLGMADKVNSLKENLEEINLNLEEKVKDRTRELSNANAEIEAAMEEMGAINERLTLTNRDLEHAQNELHRDMNMAAYLQSSLLPKRPPESDMYDVALAFHPKSAVSGDFYDFYTDCGRLIGAGIFDVSGHGVASGLLTLMAKSTIASAFIEMKGEPLGRVAGTVNDRLIAQIKDVDNYLTGVLLRFDGDRIEYVNCAHPDIICRKADIKKTGKILDKSGRRLGGPFLGIEHGISMNETHFQEINFKIMKGDCILLYTDSLSESLNPEEETYGEARIVGSLHNAPESSAQTILNHVVTEFYSFLAGRDIHDDLTLMLIRKK